MAYALNSRHLETAFSSGSLLRNGQRIELRRIDIGRLVVTSGALAASDPLVCPDPGPFAQAAIAPGAYPVSIAVARFHTDERIAFARVELSGAPAASWTMALAGGQDPTGLEQNGYFGYPVDAGTGCFMDPAAGQLLAARMQEDPDYFNQMLDGMEKTYQHTRSWLDWRPSPERPENIICFSSGWGDGCYPSFFGLSEQGQPTALVTDFLVLHGAE
jgi:uncharacterized protein DUF4241